MAELVYVLGAGFGCSVLDPARGAEAPLAKNFFQVLLGSRRRHGGLDGFRQHVYVDILLEEIERYWHLNLDGLRTESFDIEECLTLFESQTADVMDVDREIRLARASFALRQMLLSHLGDLSHGAYTPAARRFGEEVHAAGADVLTFNYDTLAEESIASASGIGPKTQPAEPFRPDGRCEVPDEDLDASHLLWRPALASGFEFDEVTMPIAGISQVVTGERYYKHPNNRQYANTRVLKLHGSVDWLRYTDERSYPAFEGEEARPAKAGIVLERHPTYWLGRLPSRDVWQMEPVIIPPMLYKHFTEPPFPKTWQAALDTLRDCRTLVVIGYSFPPTDFRTRRLFLEAFSDHRLEQLIVVNPDPAAVGLARRLTHHDGAVVSCDDLRSLYGLPVS